MELFDGCRAREALEIVVNQAEKRGESTQKLRERVYGKEPCTLDWRLRENQGVAG